MASRVRDNRERSRFELEENGLTAIALYRRDGGTLFIRHVEAPPALRGTGAAGRLMEGVATAARAEGLRLVPLCGYAASWLDRHPEHRDIVA